MIPSRVTTFRLKWRNNRRLIEGCNSVFGHYHTITRVNPIFSVSLAKRIQMSSPSEELNRYLTANHISLDQSQFNDALNRYAIACLKDDGGLSAEDLHPVLRGDDVYTTIGARKRRKVMCKLCNEGQWDDKGNFLGHCNKHLRCNRKTVSQVLVT